MELAYRDENNGDNSGEVYATITVETEVACVCGDGRINNNEQCDDGNTEIGDGCNSVCVVESCGDGYIDLDGADNNLQTVEDNEECDDGENVSRKSEEDHPTYCNDLCKLASFPICGDGLVNQEGEQCDDGNDNDNDTCSNSCQNNGDGDVCELPEVGSTGIDQTFGSNYVVCRADEQSAWVAHNDPNGNHYNALQICETLGYSTVTAWGGTCGTICGYCGNQGNEYYDGAGYFNLNDIAYTVHRRCEGFSEECIEQPDPYCGDGIVNQESEQCDNGHDLDMAFVKVAREE